MSMAGKGTELAWNVDSFVQGDGEVLFYLLIYSA